MGHNSGLQSYVERLEQLESDKADITNDIRELCAEAKEKGLDPRALKAVVKQRRETDEQRQKRKSYEEILDDYKAALGMLADTPLGAAALQRAQVSA